MAVSVYSCVNCGGPVRFDIPTRTFKCERCASTYTLDEMNRYFPDDEQGSLWNQVSESGDGTETAPVHILNAEERETLVKAYDCPFCGAELMADSDTLAAAYCAFCNSPVTISERLLSGENMPSRVIPFKISRDEAYEIIRKKLRFRPLLSKEFKVWIRPREFKSVYIPFRLYDADCSASITARCENHTSWRSGDYEYTRTDTYEARRSGGMDFAQVPTDASDKIDDEGMQAIEPFDTSELTPFSAKYLAGHYAEAPTTKDSWSALFSRLKPAAENAMLDTVWGYNSVSLTSGSVSIDRVASEYVMFPVWMIVPRFKDKEYIFAINGQTGQFTGDIPADWAYARGLFLKLALILSAAAFIGLEVMLWLS